MFDAYLNLLTLFWLSAKMSQHSWSPTYNKWLLLFDIMLQLLLLQIASHTLLHNRDPCPLFSFVCCTVVSDYWLPWSPPISWSCHLIPPTWKVSIIRSSCPLSSFHFPVIIAQGTTDLLPKPERQNILILMSIFP